MGPSLFTLGRAAVETLRISIPAVVGARRGTLTVAECDEHLGSWAARLLQQVDAEVQVSGREHLESTPGPYVVVSNHQSLYDIPVLFQALPLSLRMAAKKELFQTPIWGRAMTAAGFVEIDRQNGKRALLNLKKAGRRMKQEGVSLHIAPEGTRSTDGQLGEFKRGAFSIARALDFPLVPVAIHGAMDIHRAGSFQVHRGRQVNVRILPVISPQEFGSTEGLSVRVRQCLAEALDDLKQSGQPGAENIAPGRSDDRYVAQSQSA